VSVSLPHDTQILLVFGAIDVALSAPWIQIIAQPTLANTVNVSCSDLSISMETYAKLKYLIMGWRFGEQWKKDAHCFDSSSPMDLMHTLTGYSL
jgi:hypothetical protein